MVYGGSHEAGRQAAGAMQYPLTDAHAHIGSMAELEERLCRQIPSMISAGCSQEAGRLEEILEGQEKDRGTVPGFLIPTYGLHPWHASLDALKRMEPFLERSAFIGEIGMDSVWCEIPLGIQQEVFEYQLAFAARKGKPVILHTKGQEKTIADIIRNYPNRYLLHWYSSEFWQETYLEMDCYCSIGPDVWWNPAVRKLVQQVPAERILIETDGMGAVRWAYEEADVKQAGSGKRQVPPTLEAALEDTLETVAGIRGTGCLALATQIKENFMRFCR